MGLKSIITNFRTFNTNKDYKNNSIFLNVESADDGKIIFELFHSGSSIAKGKSRIAIDTSVISQFSDFIGRVSTSRKTGEPLSDIQKELSKLTDDILPKKISDFLIQKKASFKYLTIDDESVTCNIPYNIFFFPDPSVTNCLSTYGFFLAEHYTVARSDIPQKVSSPILSMLLLSSDDLTGSTKEEYGISQYINSLSPGTAVTIDSKRTLEDQFKQKMPHVFHLCCHGDKNCNIIFKKNGTTEILDMDFFNLFRFPENSLIVLNICNSNYTLYADNVPRSIANKLIDRNGGLVIVTEWPINDDFAYTIGTNIYRSIENKKTLIQIISETKRDASSSSDKLTAISYSLKGNPNLVLEI